MKNIRLLLLFGSAVISLVLTHYTVSHATDQNPGLETNCPLNFYQDNSIETYSKCAQPAMECFAGGGGSGTVDLSNVPNPWRSLIDQTAPKYPTADARLVAATLWVENRGWPEYKTSGWGVSSAAAAGPWQFIPSTWASMGTDGDGDGKIDRDNPKDAVHAAFKHQLGSAGKPIVEGFNEGLGVEAGLNIVVNMTRRKPTNLLTYLANYNGRGAPNNKAMNNYPRNENSDYVVMGYWLLASNFQRGYIFNKGVVDAKTYGGIKGTGYVGTNNNASNQEADIGVAMSCGSTGNGIVNADGYAFPVGIPKSQVGNFQPGGWNCVLPCHHGERSDALKHNAAMDLTTTKYGNSGVGKSVFAMQAGTIGRVSQYAAPGCVAIHLKSEDGWGYWNGHLRRPSVQPNQKVTAGQQIAEIGERKCTGNGSDPHLHIDRGFPKGKSGGTPGRRDPDLIGILKKLHDELPNQ